MLTERHFQHNSAVIATFIPAEVEIVESESSKASVLDDLELEDRPLEMILDSGNKSG